MRTVILAAGVGSRLGSPYPKPLTALADGESILGRQIRLLGSGNQELWFCIVVGFKKDLIIEEFPDCLFVYNQDFGDTNTSKSLLKALEATGAEPVLWLNGDVVFDERLVPPLFERIAVGESFVCVDTKSVGEEEVKYSLDEDGYIREISKSVSNPLGEAVGINYVAARDKPALVRRLRECDDQDYFERGLELGITGGEMKVAPFDISSYPCIEVDFAEDLSQARELFE